MQNVLNNLGMMIRPHFYELAMMIIATLLVIYGAEVNRMVKRQVAHWHFVFRTLVFIVVCAFGYGWLTVWFTPVLAGWLSLIPLHLLAVSTIGILFFLGFLAERKRQL